MEGKTLKTKRTFLSFLPFPLRLISIFLVTSLLSLAMSLYLNQNVNRSLARINNIYTSNDALNEMSSALSRHQESLKEYLETKSTDSLNQYYFYEQKYQDLLSGLNRKTLSSVSGSMEKNIYHISQNYLSYCDEAVEAKRARNTPRYRSKYAEATEYYNFLTSYIYSLNNEQFISNSRNYQSLEASLRMLQRISGMMNIAVALFNIFLIIILVSQITRPILELANASNEVAEGNFNVELPPVTSDDEIGTMTNAFNQMVLALKDYIEKVKSSIKSEKEAQERELLMETHLKDAQLRYYQAQVNPHFLFNSLNAGVQMAMMEDAEKTSTFLQNMADFFRYSMKSLQTDVYLEQEIELVENYLSIMNVRFSGDIHFYKNISCDITNVQVPCMIIQPVVENAIQYGIRNISWEGEIHLDITREEHFFSIQISDNGIGISEERLTQIRERKITTSSQEKNSNGIGLGNVQARLELYYNRDGLFHIESPGENLGTVVTIFIPINS